MKHILLLVLVFFFSNSLYSSEYEIEKEWGAWVGVYDDIKVTTDKDNNPVYFYIDQNIGTEEIWNDIYIATRYPDSEEKWHFKIISDGVSETPLEIAIDSNNCIYFATTRRLFKIKNKEVVKIIATKGYISRMIIDKKGNIYCLTTSYQLFIYNSDLELIEHVSYRRFLDIVFIEKESKIAGLCYQNGNYSLELVEINIDNFMFIEKKNTILGLDLVYSYYKEGQEYTSKINWRYGSSLSYSEKNDVYYIKNDGNKILRLAQINRDGVKNWEVYFPDSYVSTPTKYTCEVSEDGFVFIYKEFVRYEYNHSYYNIAILNPAGRIIDDHQLFERGSYVNYWNNNRINSISYVSPSTLYISGYSMEGEHIRKDDKENREFTMINGYNKKKYPNTFLMKYQISNLYSLEFFDPSDSTYPDTLSKFFCIGEDNYIDISLKNFSEKEINLKEPKVSNNIFFSAEYLRHPKMEVNDTLGIRIFLNTDSTGVFETDISIWCHETTELLDKIHIIITQASYLLTSDNINLDFGYIKTGKTYYLDAVYSNRGLIPIEVDSVKALSNEFQIVWTKPELPNIIYPSETLKVRVLFRPEIAGTYSDTLKLEIFDTSNICATYNPVVLTGMAYDYDLMGDSLYFGRIADCSEKPDTAYIVNFSYHAPSFSNPEITGSDADNFELIGYPDKYQKFSRFDSAMFVVKYKPLSAGEHYAELHVRSSLPDDSLMKIPLYGISSEMKIEADDVYLGTCPICGELSGVLKIRNNSEFDVVVNDIICDDTELEFDPDDLLIKADSEGEVDIQFKPETFGHFESLVSIISVTPCEDTIHVKVSADVLKSEVKFSKLDDFGLLEYCSDSTQILNIKNTGQYDVEIRGVDISGVESQLFEPSYKSLPFTLQADSVFNITLTFRPASSSEGMKEATLTCNIFIDEEEKNYTFPLEGEKGNIKYRLPEKLDIMSKLNFPEQKDIEIYNSGNIDIIISDCYLKETGEFSVINNIIGNTIKPGESRLIQIQYLPTDLVADNDKLYIDFLGEECSYQDSVILNGLAKQKIIFSLPDTVGKPGEKNFCIPVTAWAEDYNGEIETDVYLKIALNYDIMLPEDRHTLAGNKFNLELNYDNVTLSSQKKDIGFFCGSLMLPLNGKSPLEFLNVKLDSDLYDIDTLNGSLDIKGFCFEEGRLVDITMEPIMEISPLPAESELNILLKNFPDGEYQINMYDINGSRQYQQAVNISNAKEKLVQINTASLSSGVYQVRVYGTNIVLSEIVTLIK